MWRYGVVAGLDPAYLSSMDEPEACWMAALKEALLAKMVLPDGLPMVVLVVSPRQEGASSHHVPFTDASGGSNPGAGFALGAGC